MPRPTLIREVMSPDPVTVTAGTSIEEAARLLAAHRFGALPVVDDDGRLVGMLRDDDLIVSEARLHMPTVFELLGATFVLPGEKRRFEDELQKVASTVVEDAMEEHPANVAPDDTVETVATLMHDRAVTHVPVVDGDGHVVGIVARGDLVRLLVAEQ
jgi:CBS domain-containing protein